MSIDMSTKLFTCGRMHKQSLKHKLHQDRTAAIVAAVRKVMQDELSKGACERWFSRLNTELGGGTFSSSESAEVAKAAEPTPVPRVWVPAKPKLTAASRSWRGRVMTLRPGPLISLWLSHVFGV